MTDDKKPARSRTFVNLDEAERVLFPKASDEKKKAKERLDPASSGARRGAEAIARLSGQIARRDAG